MHYRGARSLDARPIGRLRWILGPTDWSVGRGDARSRRTCVAEAPSSRDKILDVAEALFARRGYAGIGLREVADASGLSKSSLFHHFRSKEQLYHEVILRMLLRIRERFEADLVQGGSPRAQIERWVEVLIDTF